MRTASCSVCLPCIAATAAAKVPLLAVGFQTPCATQGVLESKTRRVMHKCHTENMRSNWSRQGRLKELDAKRESYLQREGRFRSLHPSRYSKNGELKLVSPGLTQQKDQLSHGQLQPKASAPG